MAWKSIRDDALLASLQTSWFHYTDMKDAVILHRVAAGQGWVYVIGQPNWASYEWVEVNDDRREIVRHTDAGYGSAVAALRDGLTVAEPPGDDGDPERLVVELASVR